MRSKVSNMPTAEILSIGSELIEGLRTNTNATWLARRLTAIGIRVTRITTVGDVVEDVAAAVRASLSRSPDVIVITGGLGPTIDDRTSEALALATRRRLVLDPAALEVIKLSYERMHARGLILHKGISSARRKMAFIPDGATALPNPVGTAPGIRLMQGKTLIICLPGVPAEMRAIFTKYVRGDLVKFGQAQHRVSIDVRGIDEATLAPLLERLAKKFPRLDVRSYPSGKGVKGRIRVMLVASAAAEAKDAEKTFNRWLNRLRFTSPR
jgi:molybdenum cofactor synthesis domain-containing protein